MYPLKQKSYILYTIIQLCKGSDLKNPLLCPEQESLLCILLKILDVEVPHYHLLTLLIILAK